MIEFSPENEQFLASAIASGAYPSREEALDRAVDLLRERQEALERLRREPVELPELPPSLVRGDEGYVCVRGQRIGLHLILERCFAGDQESQIQQQYPSLAHEQLAEILEFARRHEREMRAYLAHREALEQLLHETGRRGPAVADLRARWQAKFGQPLAAPHA